MKKPILLIAIAMVLASCGKESIKPSKEQTKDTSGPKNNLGTAD